jgi:putative tricarboxylic transport membrane protein
MEQILTSMMYLLSPMPLFLAFLGVFLGATFGAIPGLTGSMLIALSLPATYHMESASALVLLVGIYVGCTCGGLITAILFRMPGTPSAIVTVLDGYPMAKKGDPGRAIGLGIMASFMGGLISWIVLVLLARRLSELALKFGPFEFFSLVLMALVLIAGVSEGSFLKGLLSGFLGLLIACPGIDPVTMTMRLDFGFTAMAGGLPLLPVIIGIFGLSQLFTDLSNVRHKVEMIPFPLGKMYRTFKTIGKHWVNILRSGLIGTWIGILPGIGANIGSIVAYTVAKNTSKTPEKFGTGCEEGIIASETGNNATIGGALIPLISLGIPGSLIDALLIAALVLHGIVPGPQLFVEHADLAYAIIGTAFIGNIMMVLIMLWLSAAIAKIANIPKTYLIPVVIVLCVLGSYAYNNRIFDVWIMFACGLIGFILERAKIPLAPLCIGFVLGPIAEKFLRSGLMLSDGSWLPLITRPFSAVFLFISVLTFVWIFYKNVVMVRRKNPSTI